MSIRVGKENVREIDMSVLKPVVAEPEVKEPEVKNPEKSKQEEPAESKQEELEVKEPVKELEAGNGKGKTKKGK